MPTGKNKLLVISLSLLMTALLGVSFAADQAERGKDPRQWVNVFPAGSDIHTFLVDPHDANLIYASTHRGMFKSIDGGKFWSPLLIFKENKKAEWSVICFDPSDPKKIYLGIKWDSVHGSLWKSSDLGIKWVDISAGVINRGVYSIAINPQSPEILYAATDEGLYKSLNEGKTWGKIANGPAYSVFLDPKQSSRVYSTFKTDHDVVLHRSENAGQNFELITPKYTTMEKTIIRIEEKMHKCQKVDDASINQHDTQEIFLRCDWSSGWYDFLKSSDSGQSWKSILNPRSLNKRNVSSWYIDPTNKDTIYIVAEGARKDTFKRHLGNDLMMKSSDGGSTWSGMPAPPVEIIQNMLVHPSGIIFVNTDYGMFKTTDQGQNWEPISYGLPTRMSNTQLVAASATGEIYVGKRNGYWASNEKRYLWQWTDFKDNLVQISAANDATIFIGVTKGVETHKHIYKKSKSDNDLLELKMSDRTNLLSISPSDSKMVYALSGSTAFGTHASEQLSKSDDGGFSWSKIDIQKWLKLEGKERVSSYVSSLYIDPYSSRVLLAGVRHLTGNKLAQYFSFLISSDGGSSWHDASSGLLSCIKSTLTTAKIPIPLHFEKNDLASLFVLPTAVYADHKNYNVIFFTTKPGGVYRTKDGGKTWKYLLPIQYLKRKIPLQIYDVAIDPADSRNVYLATSDGIYKSTDQGESWHLFNNGLIDAAIDKLIFTPHMKLAVGESGIYALSTRDEFQQSYSISGVNGSIGIKTSSDVVVTVAPAAIPSSATVVQSKLPWLNGTWEGVGRQGIYTWKMRLSVQPNSYTVSYPDLKCSGYWHLTQAGDTTATFTEYITTGKGNCSDNIPVIVTKLSANEIQCSWTEKGITTEVKLSLIDSATR